MTHVRFPRRGYLARAGSIAVATLLAATACSDSSTRIIPSPRRAEHSLTHQDSLMRGFVRSRSSARGSALRDAVSDGTAAILDLTPGTFQGFDQPETITGLLSGRVNSITVVGSGAINCSGDYGTLIGYDANGVVLGQIALSLIDEADCSPTDNPDGVTFGAQATLTVTTGVIAKFEIVPMSPVEFPVFDLVGHASADYTITLGVSTAPTFAVTCTPAAPVRADIVTCTAMMSDTSAFTPTHRKSSSGGNVIVDEDIPAGAPVTKYDWPGRAIVPTDIVISATASGPVSATGSFGIVSRIGLRPDWMDPDFLDFQETAPAPSFVGGAPLTASYPGIVPSADTNGYFAGEGALGYTVFKYPTGAEIISYASGPNKSVKVVRKSIWEVPAEAGGAAAGVYVEQSLRSSDPFYQRQVGPSPFCTQANMLSLSSTIQNHEATHWTAARAATKPLKIQTALEALVQLPGGASIADARQAIQDSFGFAAAAANADVEHNQAPLPGHLPVCDMRP